jgi:hypothetical protein
VPPGRQSDDEQAGVAARGQHPFLTRRTQQRLGRDAEDALDGDGAVREQAARVALPLLGDRRRADEAEWRIERPREPCAEFDGRPVVLGAAEGDEHRALRPPVSRNQQRYVAGRRLEDGRELFVGGSGGEQRVGSGSEEELDVELAGEPSQLRAGSVGREGGRTSGHAASLERGAPLLDPGGCAAQLGRGGHEPGEDEDARRLSREQLGQDQ